MDLDITRQLVQEADTTIVFLVMDGLGGLPKVNGATELETARTPNLNGLAEQSVCGLHQLVGPGVTPGSGPGHLGLFGYDPVRYQVGRGVLGPRIPAADLMPLALANALRLKKFGA